MDKHLLWNDVLDHTHTLQICRRPYQFPQRPDRPSASTECSPIHFSAPSGLDKQLLLIQDHLHDPAKCREDIGVLSPSAVHFQSVCAPFGEQYEHVQGKKDISPVIAARSP